MSECTYDRTAGGILRTIIITTGLGATFIVSDSEDCKDASLALAEFQRGGIMHLFIDDEEYFVPASAVDNIQVTVAGGESE